MDDNILNRAKGQQPAEGQESPIQQDNPDA